VSRINIDNHTMLNSNEKQELRFVTPKVNQLYKRITGKYSRLFATHKKQNIKGL